MRRKILAISAAVLTAGALAMAPQAHAQTGVKVGVLTCHVDSGWGFIFGSSRDLKCDYAPAPNVSEHYSGQIMKFGADIGYLQAAVIVWGVFAPSANVAPGALAGNYAGATATATVGVGTGANVLVGGGSNSFTLQPISIEGNSGLNVAAGIAALQLKYEK